MMGSLEGRTSNQCCNCPSLVSHHISRDPFPVAETWDMSLVALVLLKVLVLRKAGAEGVKHALTFSREAWDTNLVALRLVYALLLRTVGALGSKHASVQHAALGQDGPLGSGVLLGTLRLCPVPEARAGGDKITSHRQKQRDYQHPAPHGTCSVF